MVNLKIDNDSFDFFIEGEWVWFFIVDEDVKIVVVMK